MNARLADLTENFLRIFWETTEEIFQTVHYNERQGLMWKALYQKDAFVAGVTAIRDEMLAALAENREQMASDLQFERLAFEEWISENTSAALAAYGEMKANVVAAGAEALSELLATVEELGAGRAHGDEISNLKAFIYDLATLRFNPNGNGNAHGDGVQPYGQWVANRISSDIGVYGVSTLKTFDTVTLAAVQVARTIVTGEEAALAVDNQNLQSTLNGQTTGLIDTLISVRQSLELRTTAETDAIQTEVERVRDLDMIEMTSEQNRIWKNLSWIVRETLASGRHNHGYRAGPVFGYRSEFAQVADDNPVNYLEKPPKHGWGAEGPEDGYDPYGYGDWGWGFGKSQTQYKEVDAQLDDMEAVWARMEAQRAARMAAALADFQSVQAVALGEFQDAVAVKQAAMEENVRVMNLTWAAILEARQATVAAALADARAKIAEANRVKVEALDAEEKEVRWAITAVWNYDVQHALNEALTAARAERDQECADLNAALEAALRQIEADWEAWKVQEQASLDANTLAQETRCADAQARETALFATFQEEQRAAYAVWEAAENQIVADHIAASREAWEWIQVSYCLRHGEAGDVTAVGFGCSWGTGAGAGNAGYKKGVAIEAHMEALTYGQDPIDIKHVHDEAWLIEGAKTWTMQGVQETADRLLDVDMAEAVATIEAEVTAVREALEARLVQQVADADARMNQLADEQAAALLAREEAVVAAVAADRATWEQAVDDLRTEVQWAIKELVWQLGYTSGYKFGAHDGKDAEIMALISAEKDRYAALIAAQIEKMRLRVAAEQDKAEVAYRASQALADALQARENTALEALIVDTTAQLNAAIAQGEADFERAAAAARAELVAFIEARLAAWKALHDQEAVNAKWQEDSYYRLSLLRLLREKQDAIDAAVAKQYREFDAAIAALRAGLGLFMDDTRAAWGAAVSARRADMVAAIAANDARMADIISTRRASLNAALAAQQDALLAAMEEDRAEMKRLLKEVYNYNTHDLDAAASADGSAAPFSVEQHNGFMAKLHYWGKEVLSGKDAQLADARDRYAARSAGLEEEARRQRAAAVRDLEDDFDASERRLTRMAEDLLESYTDLTEIMLAQLGEGRALEEHEAAAAIEKVRKAIIYATHVQRYGGGLDAQATGFGVGASTFYARGDALTGVDELDEFRLGNPHGYAQVSAPVVGSDDAHDASLEAQLEQAQVDFEAILARASAAMAELTAGTIADAGAQGQADIDAIVAEGARLLAQQAALVDRLAVEQEQSDFARRSALLAETSFFVRGLRATCDTEQGKVEQWIADRLAWAAKMPESYRKKHLIQELEATRTRLLGELEARVTEALADAEAANQALSDSLEATAAGLAADSAAFQGRLGGVVAGTTQQVTAGVGARLAAVTARAQAMEAALNAVMAQNRMDFAYWLKYHAGYQGYESSIYQDFDYRQDYSNITGYPAGDGAYSDLGTQGPDLGNSGVANLPSGGFGYGGRGGVDYLYSGDHAALAYGKQIGPDPAYFRESILDAAVDSFLGIDY